MFFFEIIQGQTGRNIIFENRVDLRLRGLGRVEALALFTNAVQRQSDVNYYCVLHVNFTINVQSVHSEHGV